MINSKNIIKAHISKIQEEINTYVTYVSEINRLILESYIISQDQRTLYDIYNYRIKSLKNAMSSLYIAWTRIRCKQLDIIFSDSILTDYLADDDELELILLMYRAIQN